MKKLLLSILLVAAFNYTYSQLDRVSYFGDADKEVDDPYYFWGINLVKLKPENTSMSFFDPFELFRYEGVSFYAYSTIDAKNKRFFSVLSSDEETPLLYTISLENGALLNAVEFPVEYFSPLLTINTPVLYHDFSESILAITYDPDSPADSVLLVSILPETAEFEVLMKLPNANYNIVHQSFNPYTNSIYLSSKTNYWSSDDFKIHLINLDTYTITSVDVNTDDYDFYTTELALNCMDGFIYGYDAIYDPTTGTDEYRITKINPLTGEKFYLTKERYGKLHTADLVLNPFTSKLYFSDGQFIDFDIQKYLLEESDFTEQFYFHTFHIYIPQNVNANFSVYNFCANAATTCSAYDTAAAWQWDFGDPSSGINNISFERAPEHIYATPGEYTVTLIAKTCYEEDTISKVIIIESFPDINLGGDFSMCENALNEPVVLSVDAPEGSEYTWSNFSHDDTLLIYEPGEYWVKISGGCGNVYDTINVLPEDCSCDILLYPNLTHSICKAEIECTLENYSDLNFFVFNMLGERMFQMPVKDQYFEINVYSWPYGPYVYIFESNGEIIARGKIEVVE